VYRGRQAEMNAVVGQNRMDFIRNGFCERDKESRRCDAVGLFNKLYEGKF
jgi:hypothetical protein